MTGDNPNLGDIYFPFGAATIVDINSEKVFSSRGDYVIP